MNWKERARAKLAQSSDDPIQADIDALGASADRLIKMGGKQYKNQTTNIAATILKRTGLAPQPIVSGPAPIEPDKAYEPTYGQPGWYRSGKQGAGKSSSEILFDVLGRIGVMGTVTAEGARGAYESLKTNTPQPDTQGEGLIAPLVKHDAKSIIEQLLRTGKATGAGLARAGREVVRNPATTTPPKDIPADLLPDDPWAQVAMHVLPGIHGVPALTRLGVKGLEKGVNLAERGVGAGFDALQQLERRGVDPNVNPEGGFARIRYGSDDEQGQNLKPVAGDPNAPENLGKKPFVGKIWDSDKPPRLKRLPDTIEELKALYDSNEAKILKSYERRANALEKSVLDDIKEGTLWWRIRENGGISVDGSVEKNVIPPYLRGSKDGKSADQMAQQLGFDGTNEMLLELEHESAAKISLAKQARSHAYSGGLNEASQKLHDEMKRIQEKIDEIEARPVIEKTALGEQQYVAPGMPERQAAPTKPKTFTNTEGLSLFSDDAQQMAEQTNMFGPAPKDPMPPPLTRAVPEAPTVGNPLRYDPSVDRHSGIDLRRGDILKDDSGVSYEVDRDSGFILQLVKLDEDGNHAGMLSASVDPTDKVRFKDLYPTGKNKFGSPDVIPADTVPAPEAPKTPLAQVVTVPEQAPRESLPPSLAAKSTTFDQGTADSAFGSAKTGQPFKTTLIRGQGRSDSPYSEFVAQEPILGDGLYTSSNKEFAEHFGPDITSHDVNLKNPIVLRTDDEWKAVVRQAGWKYQNPFGLPPQVISQHIKSLRGLLERLGHDGVIIDPSDFGDEAKVLRDVFGEKQVVEFGGTRPATKTATPSSTVVSILKGEPVDSDVDPVTQRTNQMGVPANTEVPPEKPIDSTLDELEKQLDELNQQLENPDLSTSDFEDILSKRSDKREEIYALFRDDAPETIDPHPASSRLPDDYDAGQQAVPEAPKTPPIDIPPEFEAGKQGLKDLTAFQASARLGNTTDIIHAVDTIDGSLHNGIVRRYIMEPVDRALFDMEKAQHDFVIDFQKALNRLKIKRGSESSRQVFLAGDPDPTTGLPRNTRPLTANEKTLLSLTKKTYADLLTNINKSRASVGMTPIAERPDYITHIWEESWLDEVFDGNSHTPGADLLRAAGGKGKPWFPYMQRKGAGGFKEDVVDALAAYTPSALKQIHMLKPVTDARGLVSALPDELPNAKKYLDNWLSEGAFFKSSEGDKLLANADPQKSRFGRLTARGVRALANRMATNTIVGHIATGTVQPTSAIFTAIDPEIGGIFNSLRSAGRTALQGGQRALKLLPQKYRPTIAAMDWVLSGPGYEFLKKNSRTFGRHQMQGIEHIEAPPGPMGRLLHQVVALPNELAVAFTFNSAYIKATRMGLSGRQAIDYADEMAARLQGVYNRAYQTPAMRDSLMKSTIGQYQTWMLRNFNHVFKTRLHWSKVSTPDKFWYLAKGMAAVVAGNTMMRAMGLNEPWDGIEDFLPYGNLVGELLGANERGKNAAVSVFKIPVEMGGAAWKEFSSLMQDEPVTPAEREAHIRTVLRGLALTVPPAAGNQFYKTAVGIQDVARGETPYAGKYVPIEGNDRIRALLYGPTNTEAVARARNNGNAGGDLSLQGILSRIQGKGSELSDLLPEKAQHVDDKEMRRESRRQRLLKRLNSGIKP